MRCHGNMAISSKLSSMARQILTRRSSAFTADNDLGLAVANSLAAVHKGARQIEVALNGIGERAGNTSLEEVVMGIETRKDALQCETGINTREIYRSCRLVSQTTNMPIPANKAVVGRNAFLHESGIHQDGVLKKRETYEIMSPETIGITADNLVLGKHSGRHAFQVHMAELGFYLEGDELQEAFSEFKKLCDRKKRSTRRRPHRPHRRQDGDRR